MNPTSPNSEKPPKNPASVLKPRTYDSTHPRVQKAFRRLVNWKKWEERLAKHDQPSSESTSKK